MGQAFNSHSKLNNMETNLERAQREYPKGTEYISAYTEKTRISNGKFSQEPEGNIVSDGNYIYYNGEWSKIVSKVEPVESDWDKAQRLYPIGTRYIPLTGSGTIDYIEGPKESERAVNKVVNRTDDQCWDCGYGYIYVNGVWAEILTEPKVIVATEKDMASPEAFEAMLGADPVPETNLEKAKRLYPKGTKYLPLASDGSVYSDSAISNGDPEQLTYGIDVGRGYIYVKKFDKWAEIISEAKAVEEPKVSKGMTNEQLLEKAKKDYPVGTVFKSAYSGDTFTVKSNSHAFCGKSIVVDSGPYLYNHSNGKWAEIISKPESKPSKDKPFYVVVTEDNKDILSKWRGTKLSVSKLVGLSLTNNKLNKGHNPVYETKGDTYDFGNEITFEQFLELYPEYKLPVKTSVMKELTELPEKWCITTTHESNTAICDYYDRYRNGNKCSRNVGAHFCMNGTSLAGWVPSAKNRKEGYTEITFDQFKRWVLKESDVPEYVKCVSWNGSMYVEGKIYPVQNGKIFNLIREFVDYPDKRFKPSTQAAYDAQQGVAKAASEPVKQKDMTPAEKLGYKVGDKFRVIGGNDFPIDTLVTLKIDDATHMPKFEREDRDTKWIKLSNVEPYEDYQNLTDLEVGDTVRCISENKSKIGGKGGAGWKAGKEFVISSTRSVENGKVYFPEGSGFGVYSDAVRLVKKKNGTVPAPKDSHVSALDKVQLLTLSTKF